MNVKGITYDTSDSELISDSETVSDSETLVGEERRKEGGMSVGGKAPRSSPGMRVRMVH